MPLKSVKPSRAQRDSIKRKAVRSIEGFDAVNRSETWRGPPKKPLSDEMPLCKDNMLGLLGLDTRDPMEEPFET